MSDTASDTPLPRVLHLTTAHSANDNRIYEKECRSLADSGKFSVELAAHGEVPIGGNVGFIPLGRKPASRSRRFVAGPAKGFALVTSTRFDIYHIHDPELIPVGIALSRRGRSVIWDAHEDYEMQFDAAGGKDWVPERLRSLGKTSMRQMLAAIDARATGVIAATPSIARRYGNPLTTVVGNGARLEEFSECEPCPTSRQILFIGAAEQFHLFEEIVVAVSRIPDVKLAVAGREQHTDTWNEARDLLGDRLLHLGWLNRVQLSLAMSESFLGCATLCDTALGEDNSSNKVFEFAAAGVPAIYSPNPSNKAHNLQGNHAYLSANFRADGIQAAIESAIADPVEWEARSARGRSWAESEGSWALDERELLTLYERVAILTSAVSR